MASITAAASPKLADRIPPHVYFLVSAIFHYLGPSFAVLLFASLSPPGVAWLRIAGARIDLRDLAKAMAHRRSPCRAR